MVAIGLEVEELRAASSAQSQAAADANAKVEEMKARLAEEGARHAEADQAMQQAADAAEAAEAKYNEEKAALTAQLEAESASSRASFRPAFCV